MHFTIFGAAGNMGRRIVTEAISRGHDVRAVVRTPPAEGFFPAGVELVRADATCLEQVQVLAQTPTLFIAATKPRPGDEPALVNSTAVLLQAAASQGLRLIISGGAATLVTPDTQLQVLDDRRYLQEPWLPVARACAAQHQLCQQDAQALWTYLSPPARLFAGTRTGKFRLGTDTLITDALGDSAISMEDLAVALVDEAEQGRFVRQRFTAAY